MLLKVGEALFSMTGLELARSQASRVLGASAAGAWSVPRSPSSYAASWRCGIRVAVRSRPPGESQ